MLLAMHVFHQHSLVYELLPTAIAAPQVYLEGGTIPFSHTGTNRLYMPLKFVYICIMNVLWYLSSHKVN